MFDLESAISQWRKHLIATGLRSLDALDELESHLRDDIDDLVRSGKTAANAFELAVVRIGRSVALTEEFSRVGGAKQMRRPKYLMLVSLISAGLIVWTSTWILLEKGVSDFSEGLVFAAVYLVAAYVAALPFCYHRLPSLQDAAVQKAVAATTLFVSFWIILALLNALGKIQFHLPEILVMLFWSIVPALLATVLAYDCYKLGHKPVGDAGGLDALTISAERTLDVARDEARKFHHDFVGTEHVLLALMQSGDPGIRRVMDAFGLQESVVRAEIESVVGTGLSPIPANNLRYTPRATRAVALAANEARAMGRTAADMQHVFLGLLLERGGVAGLVLRRLGVDADKARAEIVRSMGPDDREGPDPVLA
jgi:hypothetical protein